MRRLLNWLVGLMMLSVLHTVGAQSLQTKFSCSHIADDGGEKIIMSDIGEIDISDDRIRTFRWESAIHRATHGYDCDIDDDDGLQAEVRTDAGHPAWRIALKDGRAAREKRGYNFERGVNCTIRVDHENNMLTLRPSCPALCGSRKNFSAVEVDLHTGICHYESSLK